MFTTKPKTYLSGNIVTTKMDGTQVSPSVQSNLIYLSGICLAKGLMESRQGTRPEPGQCRGLYAW